MNSAHNVLVKGSAQIAPTSEQIDYILLDASGSMSPKWWDMLAALDDYIKALRREHIDSRLILKTFTTGFLDYQWRDERMATTTMLCDNPPGLHGLGTPLYDAINVMARTLRDLNPPQCSVVICTDGKENESRTTVQQAKQLLDWMRLRGWQVTFIGAEFNNSQMAASLGGTASSLGTSMKQLSNAFKLLADRRARYARTGEAIEFTDAERTKFGGYLSHG